MVAPTANWDSKPTRARDFPSAGPGVIEHNARIPTQDEIQVRAYEIYERNGRQDGRCEQNWREAERELIAECHQQEEDMSLSSRQSRIPSTEL